MRAAPEVKAALAHLCSELRSRGEEARRMLRRLDGDRNGTISGTLRRADAARCLREMGLQLRAGELSMVMDEFDRSGEGLVDYDEMLRAIERWDHSAEWAASSAPGRCSAAAG